MNTMIDGTSLDVLQQRAVEARDGTQALLRCGELDQPPGTLLPEVELQTREPRMREALDVAFKTAASEATILLRGESGAGKEVLARAIHARSPRSARPLATLHCPGLSAELLESELFGHVQGACPGARAGYGRKSGRRGRGHPFPQRNRRPAAGLATQALAAAAGTLLRAGGRIADAGQRHSRPRGHQPQPGGRACRRPFPGRPLLPVECHRSHRPAAPRPASRYLALGGAPAAVLRPAGRQVDLRV